MLNPSPVVPPTSPKPPTRPTRAYDVIFWFLVLGLVLATFTALMAVGTLMATARPVMRWRVPLPPSAAVTPTDPSAWQTYRNEELGFEVRYPDPLMNVAPYVDPQWKNEWVAFTTKYQISPVSWGSGKSYMTPFASLYFRLEKGRVSEVVEKYYNSEFRKLEEKIGGRDVYLARIGVEGTGQRYYYVDGGDKTMVVMVPFFGANLGEESGDEISEAIRATPEFQMYQKLDLERSILATFKFVE